MPSMHKELDGVVWVAPILVLVGCDVHGLNATYQSYEGVTMGGNPTVAIFLGTSFFSWARVRFKGGWVV